MNKCEEPAQLYTVKFTAKESKYQNGDIATENGTVFFAVHGEWGPTGSKTLADGSLSAGLLSFKTVEEATAFGKRWKGHPWWYEKASFEVVPVKAVTRTVTEVVGYREEPERKKP